MPGDRSPKLQAPDPYATGRFPISAQTHHVGQRLLFDLATVVMVLDCQPGDRVLDLGAGAGFSTEMLARFGYDVVALDPDHTALRHNMTRADADRARIDGRWRVVEGVCEALPFRSASVDGIVGMNVMHHVRDLPVAVSELARVLRPGCRAVFSEPGLDHLQTAETVRAVSEHGEGDQAFDVLMFGELAKHMGFAHAMLTATIHPVFTLLPMEDVPQFEIGEHRDPLLTPAGVISVLRHQHPFAILIREGIRRKTSRYPGALRAEVQVDGTGLRAKPGTSVHVHVRARNTGDSTWLAAESALGGYVTFGCKLLTGSGRLVVDTLGRTLLEHDVPPGGEAQTDLTIELPRDLAPGSYRLTFDLVNELVCWFSDAAPGSAPGLDLTIE